MHPIEPAPVEPVKAQVVRVLSGVSAHGDQHLTEVERDLAQMDVLLDEAVKKLCASFMAIHQAVTAQQETLDALLAGKPAPQLQALREDIGRHIGAAVTGLQFQDMTSQLIARMAKHLAGLREMFDTLGSETGATGEGAAAEVGEALDRIHACVGADCAERSVPVRSTVQQRHMESGDIELF